MSPTLIYYKHSLIHICKKRKRIGYEVADSVYFKNVFILNKTLKFVRLFHDLCYDKTGAFESCP